MKQFTFLLATLFSLSVIAQSQIDLPIDWEGTTTNYSTVDFGGNVSTLMADPLNASNTVLQTFKDTNAVFWAGVTLSDTNGLASAIPFTSTANTITVLVYSPDAGIPVRLKAEDHTDPTKSVETQVNTTVANAWDTLVFDFSNEASGTAAINYAYTYDMLSIFFNFGVDGSVAGNKTYYTDEVSFGGIASGPSNVTFQVDMNSYSGTFTTPEVNGTFNNWCGNCNSMTDSNGDGVWEITLPLIQDSIEFKFSHDNWTGQENLIAGMTCTKTDGGFTNRFMHLSGDTVLPPVCWEDCAPCGGTPATYNVTFQVDLNQYAGSFTTPEVNGTFNNWCGDCNQMTDSNGDGVWDITLPITADSIEFKFSHDNWTGQENLIAGMTCTKTDGGFTNRFMHLSGDTVLPPVCWESCDSCLTNPPAGYNVTFKVDMNDYTGAFTTPEVNGIFNAWCGNCTPMSDADGDGIWEVVVNITDDSTEYKFSFDNWTGQETLSAGAPCTKTDGNFTNRFIVLTGDTVLPEVCWESCGTCGTSSGNANITFKVDLSEYSGTYNGVYLNGTFNNWCGACAPMTSPNNNDIYELMVTMPVGDTIEYKFTLDGWTVEESLTDGSWCTKSTIDNGQLFVNRVFVPIADTVMPAVCWEQCETCGSVSVAESEYIFNVIVAPNPAKDYVNVTADLQAVEEYSVSVINVQGQILYHKKEMGVSINQNIDLSGFKSGLYVVRITGENFSRTQRLVLGSK